MIENANTINFSDASRALMGPEVRARPLKIEWGPCEILPEGPMDPQNWRIGTK